MTPTRLRSLDGLRGVAILMVVFYHAYGGTFVAYLPYGDRYAYLYPIRFGWLGVQLFFLISGFVILMTLEKCVGFKEFILRRWIRLFPAMLIGSLIIFVFVKFTALGPYGDRNAADLVPGLILVSPAVIHSITRIMLRSMDGTFWSLYVEVTFYFIFGVAYFTIGRKWAIVLIFALFLLSATSLRFLDVLDSSGMLSRIARATEWIGFVQFGWFAAGAIFYISFTERSNLMLLLAGLTGFATLSLVSIYGDDYLTKAMMTLVLSLFAISLFLRPINRLLETPMLLFFGAVSYPLYLIHSNIMIGTTGWLGSAFPTLPAVLTPFLPIGVLVIVAYLIAKFGEPPVTAFLRRRLLNVEQSKAALADRIVHSRSSPGGSNSFP